MTSSEWLNAPRWAKWPVLVFFPRENRRMGCTLEYLRTMDDPDFKFGFLTNHASRWSGCWRATSASKQWYKISPLAITTFIAVGLSPLNLVSMRRERGHERNLNGTRTMVLFLKPKMVMMVEHTTTDKHLSSDFILTKRLPSFGYHGREWYLITWPTQTFNT